MLTISTIGKGSNLIGPIMIGSSALPSVTLAYNNSHTPLSWGSAPDEGPMNSVGDRECFHFNLKGSISVISRQDFLRLPDTIVPFYNKLGKKETWTYPCYQSGGVITNDIMLSGSEYRFTGPKMYDLDGINYTQEDNFIWTESLTVYRQILTSRTVTPSGSTRYYCWCYRMQWNTSWGPGYPAFSYYRSVYATFSDPALAAIWEPANLGYWDTYPSWPRSTINFDPIFHLPSSEEILTRFKDTGIIGDLLHQERFTWGDLVQRAADNTKYLEINTPMYFADFTKWKAMFIGLKQTMFQRPTLKSLSQVFLTFKYGLSLTVRDSKEIVDATLRALDVVRNPLFQVSRSRASVTHTMSRGFGRDVPISTEYNYKMYYSPIDNALLSLFRTLYEWDMMPTLDMAWDFIPFSFVVDWFVDVGSALEAMSSPAYISMLDIVASCCTTRSSATLLAPDLFGSPQQASYLGNVDVVVFQRTTPKIPPSPLPRLEVPTSFDHVVEGAALFFANK